MLNYHNLSAPSFLSKTIPRYSKNKKAEKFCLLLNKFTLIAPILAFIIFSVLLSTTLKGKFMERSSHAMILTFMVVVHQNLYFSDEPETAQIH